LYIVPSMYGAVYVRAPSQPGESMFGFITFALYVQQQTFPMFKHVTFAKWCMQCIVIIQSDHERLQCCNGLLRHCLRLFVGSKECPYRPE
jgi:hypothetical protein